MRRPAVFWLIAIFVLVFCGGVLAAPPANAVASDAQQLRARCWIDASGTARADDVSRLASTFFAPCPAGAYLGLRPGQAAWLRFQASSASQERWYLAAPDTRVDRVTLYSPGDRGELHVQSAGDAVPVSEWPVPQAWPLFPIALGQADRQFLMRIEASDDTSVVPVFRTESSISQSQQHWALVNGLYFGLITMVVIYAWVCSFIFRDRAYMWLGWHALFVNLVVARVTGLAGAHLWPTLAAWNDAAEHVLSILCLSPLLGFVAVALSVRGRSGRAYWSLFGLAMLAFAGAGAAAYLPMPMRMTVATCFVVGLSLVALCVTAWFCWLGDTFARWVIVAFAPMLVALPFPILRWLQWLPQSQLTEHAMQVGLWLTLPAMLLLMLLRSHERSDYRRRISRLEHIDPLTGLVNDEVFGHRLRAMIQRSQRLGQQSAVVVVEFTNLNQLAKEFGRKSMLQVMLRIAGRLTNTMRPIDTVARIGDRRYGVLMEGPVPAERGAQLASKIMARLIVPFSGLPVGLVARPRIAVVLVPEQAASVEEALQRLDILLMEAHPDGQRRIYVADSGSDMCPT